MKLKSNKQYINTNNTNKTNNVNNTNITTKDLEKNFDKIKEIFLIEGFYCVNCANDRNSVDEKGDLSQGGLQIVYPNDKIIQIIESRVMRNKDNTQSKSLVRVITTSVYFLENDMINYLSTSTRGGSSTGFVSEITDRQIKVVGKTISSWTSPGNEYSFEFVINSPSFNGDFTCCESKVYDKAVVRGETTINSCWNIKLCSDLSYKKLVSLSSDEVTNINEYLTKQNINIQNVDAVSVFEFLIKKYSTTLKSKSSDSESETYKSGSYKNGMAIPVLLFNPDNGEEFVVINDQKVNEIQTFSSNLIYNKDQSNNESYINNIFIGKFILSKGKVYGVSTDSNGTVFRGYVTDYGLDEKGNEKLYLDGYKIDPVIGSVDCFQTSYIGQNSVEKELTVLNPRSGIAINRVNTIKNEKIVLNRIAKRRSISLTRRQQVNNVIHDLFLITKFCDK